MGAKRLAVESHGGVLRARAGGAVVLEDAVVGGGQHDAAGARKWSRSAMARATPSCGIGARAQLVQEHEGPRGCAPARCRRGSSRGRRRWTGTARWTARRRCRRRSRRTAGRAEPSAGGDLHAELVHEGEEPDGLQAHRLSARVRPGDDEHAVVAARRHGDGNDAAAQEGVAGVAQERAPHPDGSAALRQECCTA